MTHKHKTLKGRARERERVIQRGSKDNRSVVGVYTLVVVVVVTVVVAVAIALVFAFVRCTPFSFTHM